MKIMNREKLLEKIKEELLRKYGDSSYHLQKTIPYYLILQNEDHELLNDLISDCNKYNFYINYEYNENNYYTYGTMSINFCSIRTMDENDEFNIGIQEQNTYYKIDLNWYDHGSTDERIPQITITKCIQSEFIQGNQNCENEFNNWYSELLNLQEKDKAYELNRIEEQIQELIKKKEKLLN
jgi:hypothetical protein